MNAAPPPLSLQDILFREVIPEDLDAVANLNALLYQTGESVPKEQIDFLRRAFFSDDKVSILFVAVHGQKIIGFLHFHDLLSLGGGFKVRHIAHLIIAPEFQGCGIGAAFMNFIKDDAIKDRCKRVDVEALKTDERPNRFYESLGFEKAADEKNYYRLYL